MRVVALTSPGFPQIKGRLSALLILHQRTQENACDFFTRVPKPGNLVYPDGFCNRQICFTISTERGGGGGIKYLTTE